MRVLTAAAMREVDRLTDAGGLPFAQLMENAAARVVELIERKFAPLSGHKIVVFCGKGDNGGDGRVVARMLGMYATRGVHIVPDEAITDAMRDATIVVDALLGTGLNRAAEGAMLDLIREIDTGFPRAKVVAVDLPSGLPGDGADAIGEYARADYTVTFTAPKLCHVLDPNCDRVGEWVVADIGSPSALLEGSRLRYAEPAEFRELFQPRVRAGHKGLYGHVLVIAGGRGKTGAAAMTGLAALRAGAGLVTVASAASAIDTIAGFAAELMTEPLPETAGGAISDGAFGRAMDLAANKTVVAIGPGMGMAEETVALVRRLVAECPLPMVVDADGLNALAGTDFGVGGGRVFTPHPGEMARLIGGGVGDRLTAARRYAAVRGVTLVLKGHRTITAFADGAAWVNGSGTPAMATGGSGDILTGMIAGLMAQFPGRLDLAVPAAVFYHGLAGELGAAEWGEKSLIATDMLRHLPRAFRAV